MLPVRQNKNPNIDVDLLKEFKQYEKKFIPEDIHVIQYNGLDVGRLRVVRSETNIYIGGIQLLPEYQGHGIGSAVIQDLIKEATKKRLSITLEVSKYNPNAQVFYKKHGFIQTGEQDTNYTMIYIPR
jgi:ribosomal protein S18 acetylase RimI-like enzyme